jgi:diguanylate cyclase (GGDEF)-like protein
MTTSVGQRAIDETAAPRRDRTIRANAAARFAARVAGSLWLRDRAVAELRWAGFTLAAMAVLALTGKVLDPAGTGFDRAILLFTPAAVGAIAIGWSPRASALMTRPYVRGLLGPAIVGFALLAAGPVDLITLTPPSAAPLVWLALAFAAITPGYPVALAIVIGSTLGVYVAHMRVVGGAEVVQDEFIVGSAVVMLATTGMYVVTRVAAEAEARATRLAARSRARVDTLEALDRIDRRFDGSRPFDQIIQSVVEDVSKEFEIALVSMYVPIDDGRLNMVGVAGYHSPFHVIDLGVGVIGRAGSSRETQFVPDVLADPDYRAARDDVRSEIAAPIVHGDELLGVVNFEGTLAHPMTTAHVALAEMLARSIASSLRSARLDEERRERLHAIERVLEVSRGLVSDLDRGRTVRAVVEAAADLLAAESVLVAGRDPQGRFVVEHETPLAEGAGRSLGEDDAVALEAVARAAPVVLDGPRSTLALPIRIDEDVAAVLVAVRPAGAAVFGAIELRIADLLVTQVAVALRNAERHAVVSDAAVRDPLTGLLNRRYFDEAVETAFANARRSGAALSLIVLDLDRFSAVNNEHGHATGDAVLRRLARTMAGAIRAGDTAARYGGEEFVVIAPGADAGAAVAVAERIRAAVAGTTIAGPDGSEVTITVSAGVASLLADELDGKALFRAADSALLAAKRAGRDRVVAV